MDSLASDNHNDNDWEMIAIVCFILSTKLLEIDYLNPSLQKVIITGNLDYSPSLLAAKEREILLKRGFKVDMKENIYYLYFLCFNNALIFTDDIINGQSISSILNSDPDEIHSSHYYQNHSDLIHLMNKMKSLGVKVMVETVKEKELIEGGSLKVVAAILMLIRKYFRFTLHWYIYDS